MDRATLKQYRGILAEAGQLLEKIGELREKAEGTTQGSTAKRRNGMRSRGRMASLVAQIADIGAQYEAKMEELRRQMEEIERAIEPLGPAERAILRARYIEGLDWERIVPLALAIGVEERTMYRMHAVALDWLESQESG